MGAALAEDTPFEARIVRTDDEGTRTVEVSGSSARPPVADRAASPRALRNTSRSVAIACGEADSAAARPSSTGQRGMRAAQLCGALERCINCLKQWRGPATRTGMRAIVHQGALDLAGILIRTRRRPGRQNLTVNNRT